MNEIIRGWKSIANHFKVSTRTIFRWNRKHPLPIYKIKNSIIVELDDLKKWMMRYRKN